MVYHSLTRLKSVANPRDPLDFNLCWTQRDNPKSSGLSKYNPTTQRKGHVNSWFSWLTFLNYLDHIEVDLPVVASSAWYEPIPILLLQRERKWYHFALVKIQGTMEDTWSRTAEPSVVNWLGWDSASPSEAETKLTLVFGDLHQKGEKLVQVRKRYRSEGFAVLTWWSSHWRGRSTPSIPKKMRL